MDQNELQRQKERLEREQWMREQVCMDLGDSIFNNIIDLHLMHDLRDILIVVFYMYNYFDDSSFFFFCKHDRNVLFF